MNVVSSARSVLRGVLAAVGLLWSLEVPALDLVRDGQAASTIVVPSEAPHWTKEAAGWIRDYVHKATGAELRIVTDDRKPEGRLISVGHTEPAARVGIDARGLKWDGCRLVVKGNTLYLVGRDVAPGRLNAFDSGAQGTCKAAVTFLEEFAGVRWFIPTPQGEHVPRRKNISVPDALHKTVVPVFAYCNGRFLYGSRGPAAFANNIRQGIKLEHFGGHSWPHWVPAGEHFEEHPEYFALTAAGRRSPGPTGDHGKPRGHVCTANREVATIMTRAIRKLFDGGVDWVQIGQSDGYARCRCSA